MELPKEQVLLNWICKMTLWILLSYLSGANELNVFGLFCNKSRDNTTLSWISENILYVAYWVYPIKYATILLCYALFCLYTSMA